MGRRQRRCNLPGARDDAAGWCANGTLYLAGGNDGTVRASEVYWAIPNNEGDIPEWKHLDVERPADRSDRRQPRRHRSERRHRRWPDRRRRRRDVSVRANTAPQSPFFQLGLVGATVPALKIEGEIGQQLGYLNAAGAGTVNFIILLLIGWAFAHKEQAKALIARVRPPP